MVQAAELAKTQEAHTKIEKKRNTYREYAYFQQLMINEDVINIQIENEKKSVTFGAALDLLNEDISIIFDVRKMKNI